MKNNIFAGIYDIEELPIGRQSGSLILNCPILGIKPSIVWLSQVIYDTIQNVTSLK